MIFILGFGRSGTTWLSDIISKSLGGLILFEPMHPQVMDRAVDFCYYDGKDDQKNKIFKDHVDKVINGDIPHRWLIRNHLPSPMEGPSQWYVDQLKSNCKIIGFKVIRGNFLIDFLSKEYPDSKIIYVRREPQAVIASIKKRTRFWEEFGIELHLNRFTETIMSSEYLEDEEKSVYKNFIVKYDGLLAKSTIMWKFTDMIVTRNLKKYNLEPLQYEDLYFKPYETVKTLLKNIDADTSSLHPSYIFTPSMLTLKTQHSFIKSDENMKGKYKDLFWDKILDENEKVIINDIINAKVKSN